MIEIQYFQSIGMVYILFVILYFTLCHCTLHSSQVPRQTVGRSNRWWRSKAMERRSSYSLSCLFALPPTNFSSRCRGSLCPSATQKKYLGTLHITLSSRSSVDLPKTINYTGRVVWILDTPPFDLPRWTRSCEHKTLSREWGIRSVSLSRITFHYKVVSLWTVRIPLLIHGECVQSKAPFLSSLCPWSSTIKHNLNIHSLTNHLPFPTKCF